MFLDIFADAFREGAGSLITFTKFMIQRIQSLYLLLTSIVSVLFLSGNFLSFFNDSGSGIFMDYRGIWTAGQGGAPQSLESQIVIPVVALLIIILSVVAIFLYKSRKIQIKFAIATVFLSAALIILTAWFAYSAGEKYQAVLSPGIRTFLPLVIQLFSILAYLGIRKDENLVRSYDRLR
ncbi:MAG: DUF4293 domain-containing protein [Bacteroidales bacterium]